MLLVVLNNKIARSKRGIYLLDGHQLLNVHFADDLALTPEFTQHSVEGTMPCPPSTHKETTAQ